VTFTQNAKLYTRTQRLPKYYLIDFGISRKYSTQVLPPLEPPILGGDKTVPEFEILDSDENSPKPSNPFPIDVYYLGT
jgi:hypothetical protein